MGMFAFGQPVLREEDPRLLRGRGDYIADKNLHGQAYAYLLRSPHAHARIVAIDTTAAKAMPCIVAVFTGDDFAADRLGMRKTHFPRARPDGSPMFENPHPCLACGQVRFAGDPVAYIVAETLAQAKDAAEVVAVKYEPLPAVVHSEDAIAPGAAAVWDACPDNISHLFEVGDKSTVDAAFAKAHHVTRNRFVISRIGMHAIEPRGCIGEFEPVAGRYTLHACIGNIHVARMILAGEVFGIAENRLRVVSGGIGIANPIERAAGPPGAETVEIRYDASGSLTMCVGTTSQGQGHETMYKVLVSDKLGADAQDIRVIQGDTDKVAWGAGTWGSRSAAVGGSAAIRAAEKIIAKGQKIAAHLLEAAEADIAFVNGSFTVAGTDRSVSLKEVARTAFRPGSLPAGMEPGLFETAVFDPPGLTFPNGCQVCEVEIDRDTGKLEIMRFSVVDDVGRVINPLTLEGQIHGGVAMGAGQAVVEHMIYSRDSGQLTTGSFLDYCLPRADDICDIETDNNPVPTKQNPLGVKGAGEAGTVGAIAAVMSAAIDALAPLGIRHIEMPLTPEKIWRAINSAGSF